MWQLVIIATLCFSVISVKVCVQAHYIVQVRVNGYSNPTGICYDERRCSPPAKATYCCDGSQCRTSDCLTRGRQSDSYFIYCLRSFGTERQLGCLQNEMRTISTYNRDDGDIDFSDSIVLGLSNPLNLSGLDMAYEGIQIYIEVKDDDNVNEDELVDLLLIDHNLAINESLQQNHTGIYDLVTMNLTVTVVCQENFEGPSCTQCAPGLTGPNCDDVDQCLHLNCSGNGHLECTNNVHGNPPSFLCTCNSGYSGRFCERIDCSTNNCSGNGVCVGSASQPSSQCNCNVGFTGRVCETRIVKCSSSPCGENGRCVDGAESFICECKPGYSGPLCREGKRGNRVTSTGSVGAIVGGVMGGIVTVVILLILFVVVFVRCKSKDNLKEVMANNHNQELTSWTRKDVTLPLDNPVYQAGNAANEVRGSSLPQITNAVTAVHQRDRIESSMAERNFDNPIYGDGDCNDHVYYTVPLASKLNQHSLSNREFEVERKVDNPIYGTENVYTLPFNKQDQS